MENKTLPESGEKRLQIMGSTAARLWGPRIPLYSESFNAPTEMKILQDSGVRTPWTANSGVYVVQSPEFRSIFFSAGALLLYKAAHTIFIRFCSCISKKY